MRSSRPARHPRRRHRNSQRARLFLRRKYLNDLGNDPPGFVAHAVAAAKEPLRRDEIQGFFDEAIGANLEEAAGALAEVQSMPGEDFAQRRLRGEHVPPGRLAQ